MKFIFTALLAVSLIAFTSCGSSEKKITEADGAAAIETKTDKKMTNFDFEEQGFLKGIVRSGKEAGSCDFVVEILGGIVAQKVDPVDMPASLKADNQLVWIKFGGLKQKNRCPEAQPVTIKDIKERAK